MRICEGRERPGLPTEVELIDLVREIPTFKEEFEDFSLAMAHASLDFSLVGMMMQAQRWPKHERKWSVEWCMSTGLALVTAFD